MRKKKQNLKRATVDRLEATFDRLAGRQNDTFDHRYRRRRGGDYSPKLLSVDRDRELFRECVRQDYAYLMAQKFAAAPDFLAGLLPQSVLGRAQNGHGWFMDAKGRPLLFADATFDRVCSVLEGITQLGHRQIRSWRNQQIDRLLKHLEKYFLDPIIPLEDDQGPMFGIDFFKGRMVAGEPFVKGLVLAGQMDDPDCRQRSLALLPFDFNGFELELGYGAQEVVRPERLVQLSLGDTGARAFSSAERRHLVELEVIVDEKKIYDYPEFDQAYFRRCLGDGVCDDLALLYIGRAYGFDAMLGAFLSDAVDTYDKFLEQCHPGGMDGYLVNQLVSLSYQTCGAPPVEEEELARLINFAAKLNLPTTRLSSSHRRLIQYESGSDQPTLLQHWKFLIGEKLPRIHLGFSREPAEKFYQTAFLRFQAAGLPVPAPQFMGKG
ncbi:MAG: hypothetical protein U9N63_09395 [Pseudomonadota bacterium]|nr:hypothetical protein [Pseudomonadota bacterium]